MPIGLSLHKTGILRQLFLPPSFHAQIIVAGSSNSYSLPFPCESHAELLAVVILLKTLLKFISQMKMVYIEGIGYKRAFEIFVIVEKYILFRTVNLSQQQI